MEKKLVLVASPPACGKNYVSYLICKSLKNVAYFDKDDLGGLIRSAFTLCNQPIDMDGEFYLNNLRSQEYLTLFKLAFSALRYQNIVLVNAPLLKEVRDKSYMLELKNKANEFGAKLVLVWVTAPIEVCQQRMKDRNSDRDKLKIQDFEKYVKGVNYTPPNELVQTKCIDKLIVFDNANSISANASLKNLLLELGENNA